MTGWLEFSLHTWMPTDLIIKAEGFRPSVHGCSKEGCQDKGGWLCSMCNKTFCITCKFDHGCRDMSPTRVRSPSSVIKRNHSPPVVQSNNTPSVQGQQHQQQQRHQQQPRKHSPPPRARPRQPSVVSTVSSDEGIFTFSNNLYNSAGGSVGSPSRTPPPPFQSKTDPKTKLLIQPPEDYFDLQTEVEQLRQERSEDKNRIVRLTTTLSQFESLSSSMQTEIETGKGLLAALAETPLPQVDSNDVCVQTEKVKDSLNPGSCPGCRGSVISSCDPDCPSQWFPLRNEKSSFRSSENNWRGAVFTDTPGAEILLDGVTVLKGAGVGAVTAICNKAIVSGSHSVSFTFEDLRGSRSRASCGFSSSTGLPRLDFRTDGVLLVNGDRFGKQSEPLSEISVPFVVNMELTVSSSKRDSHTLKVQCRGDTSEYSIPSEQFRIDESVGLVPCVKLISEGDCVRVDTIPGDARKREVLKNSVASLNEEILTLQDEKQQLENELYSAMETIKTLTPPPPVPVSTSECQTDFLFKVDHHVQTDTVPTEDKFVNTVQIDSPQPIKINQQTAMTPPREASMGSESDDSSVESPVKSPLRIVTYDFYGGPGSPETMSQEQQTERVEARELPSASCQTDVDGVNIATITSFTQVLAAISSLDWEAAIEVYPGDQNLPATIVGKKLIQKLKQTFSDMNQNKTSLGYDDLCQLLAGIANGSSDPIGKYISMIDPDNIHDRIIILDMVDDIQNRLAGEENFKYQVLSAARASYNSPTAMRGSPLNKNNSELVHAVGDILNALAEGRPLPFDTVGEKFDIAPLMIPISKLHSKIVSSTVISSTSKPTSPDFTQRDLQEQYFRHDKLKLFFDFISEITTHRNTLYRGIIQFCFKAMSEMRKKVNALQSLTVPDAGDNVVLPIAPPKIINIHQDSTNNRSVSAGSTLPGCRSPEFVEQSAMRMLHEILKQRRDVACKHVRSVVSKSPQQTPGCLPGSKLIQTPVTNEVRRLMRKSLGDDLPSSKQISPDRNVHRELLLNVEGDEDSPLRSYRKTTSLA